MELVFIIVPVIFVACLFGWVLNIVKIVKSVNSPLTGMFVLRCFGIVIPLLGAVLGYL